MSCATPNARCWWCGIEHCSSEHSRVGFTRQVPAPTAGSNASVRSNVGPRPVAPRRSRRSATRTSAAKPTRNNAPANSPVAIGADQKSRHRNRDQRQQDDGGGIDARPEAADQRRLASGLRHARMQLRDEGAIIPVLRRHQGRGLPAGRENGDALAVGIFDVGAKPARLHRHRTVRQPDRGNIGVRPHPGFAGDAPRQALRRSVRTDAPRRSATPCRRSGRWVRPRSTKALSCVLCKRSV